METKTIIIFPYNGFETASSRERLFWTLVDSAKHVDDKPLVVVNVDTERRGRADAFLSAPRTSCDVEILRVWSVDTCQSWLAGWGKVIDDHPNSDSRVVLLPGDLDKIHDEHRFFANLKGLLGTGQADIVLGDFSSENPFSSKELIDTYGTYPLLANWFAEISRAVRILPLSKPRTEFLNIRAGVLGDLLSHRKFAYEQTLNMLIRAWDFETSKWKYDIGVQVLGELQDDKSMRQYREALNQIERTERLLRLLWREIHEPRNGNDEAYMQFIDEYHQKDLRSGAIRGSAITTIRTLLGA